jgi:hypothetical protein
MGGRGGGVTLRGGGGGRERGQQNSNSGAILWRRSGRESAGETGGRVGEGGNHRKAGASSNRRLFANTSWCVVCDEGLSRCKQERALGLGGGVTLWGGHAFHNLFVDRGRGPRLVQTSFFFW